MNRLKYVIFYATNHNKGCDLMKQAIWKIAPIGDFTFKAKDEAQLFIDDYDMYRDAIEKELKEHFGTQSFIDINEIINFMKSDLTIYHSLQLKTMTLKPMEKESPAKIEVKRSPGKRNFTYSDGTKIRFL